MRPRISITGSVRPSLGRFVGRSVGRSVRPSETHSLNSPKFDIFPFLPIGNEQEWLMMTMCIHTTATMTTMTTTSSKTTTTKQQGKGDASLFARTCLMTPMTKTLSRHHAKQWFQTHSPAPTLMSSNAVICVCVESGSGADLTNEMAGRICADM